jgi:hypothetical protein
MGNSNQAISAIHEVVRTVEVELASSRTFRLEDRRNNQNISSLATGWALTRSASAEVRLAYVMVSALSSNRTVVADAEPEQAFVLTRAA